MLWLRERRGACPVGRKCAGLKAPKRKGFWRIFLQTAMSGLILPDVSEERMLLCRIYRKTRKYRSRSTVWRLCCSVLHGAVDHRIKKRCAGFLFRIKNVRSPVKGLRTTFLDGKFGMRTHSCVRLVCLQRISSHQGAGSSSR